MGKISHEAKSTARFNDIRNTRTRPEEEKNMTKIRVMDRDLKANFEIRVTNKETGTSRSFNMYAEEQTEETIRDKIRNDMKDWEKEE